MSTVLLQMIVWASLLIGHAGESLAHLETQNLVEGFQISESNPMPGVEPRAELLRSLGRSLLASQDIFGQEGRPGALVGQSKFTIVSLFSSR